MCDQFLVVRRKRESIEVAEAAVVVFTTAIASAATGVRVAAATAGTAIVTTVVCAPCVAGRGIDR